MIKLCPLCVFTVRSNARRQPDSTQQWQALLQGTQLGAAQPLGEWRPTGTTDGGGQYQGVHSLKPIFILTLPLPLPLTPPVFDIKKALRGLK